MYNAQDIWGSLVYFPKFDEGFHSNFPIFSVTKGSYKPFDYIFINKNKP